jgi:mannan polymerase II complex ANP1 subunit
MGFEVSGLPHYVIWHVYEPSEDDLIRMEEMEKEEVVKQLDVEDVDVSRARWEKDRKAIESFTERKEAIHKPQDGKKSAVGSEEGPVAHVGEEGVSTDPRNGMTGIERDKLVELREIEKI